MKFVSSLKQQEAFTLIEMMIVLMIISILLMIAVPSMTKSNEVVKAKSCEATIKLVQSQVAAYNAANETTLQGDLTPLLIEKYVDTLQCPDDSTLILDSNGKVIKSTAISGG